MEKVRNVSIVSKAYKMLELDKLCKAFETFIAENWVLTALLDGKQYLHYSTRSCHAELRRGKVTSAVFAEMYAKTTKNDRF